MKTVKLVMGSCILLNSMNLYAEKAQDCMKYWSEPAVEIKVIGETECEHIWDFGKSGSYQNRLKVLEKLNLKVNTGQWMSTGVCQEVLYKREKYKIYNADFKEDKHNIWMIYNNKSSFAYFRRVMDPINSLGEFKVELSCDGVGDDKNMKNILSSYLKSNTSISMRIYKENDWYKEK